MEDPVKLPSSGVVVDRVTIKSHLLLQSNDPYNRTPLKTEDIIPRQSCYHLCIFHLFDVRALLRACPLEPELKAHIEKFVKERRQRRGKSGSDDLYTE